MSISLDKIFPYINTVIKKRDTIIMIVLLMAVIVLAGFSLKEIMNLRRTSIAQAPNYVYVKLHPKQYFGVNVDIGQLIPGSKYYVTNSKGEDLINIAHDLGINMFRIDDAISPDGNQDAETLYTKSQWDEVLQKMNENGISAVILAETKGKQTVYTADNYGSVYLQFIKNYVIVPQVCNNPDVYGIDIANEPTLNTNNLQTFKEAAAMIKQNCPMTKITIGGWRVPTGTFSSQGTPYYRWDQATDGALLSSIVDFYAVHIYHYELQVNSSYPDPYSLTQTYLNQMKSYAANKPILIEEFGAPNGDAISDQTTIGSPQLQANTYAGVFRAVHDMAGDNVIGAVSYLFYPRGDHPESWNIIKNDGNYIFPAAKFFQSAVNEDMIALSTTTPINELPKSTVYTISSNNSTIIANSGDLIGFHLQLPWAKYTTDITGNTESLLATESLYPGWASGYYDMVVHAQNSGTAQIFVKNGSKVVFHITIEVQ